MRSWQRQLRFDPIPALLSSEDEALQYFVRRDLLEEVVGPICRLWQLPEAKKILKKQQPDGSWDRSVSKKKHEDINYNLTRPLKTLRLEVNDGQRRWQPRTPAMAASLTDHIWSVEEVLTTIMARAPATNT